MSCLSEGLEVPTEVRRDDRSGLHTGTTLEEDGGRSGVGESVVQDPPDRKNMDRPRKGGERGGETSNLASKTQSRLFTTVGEGTEVKMGQSM